MGTVDSVLTAALLVGTAYFIYTGDAKKWLDQISGSLALPPAGGGGGGGGGLPFPQLPPPGGGGGGGGGGASPNGPATAQSAGTCTRGPYPPTGPAVQTKKSGPKTRHYRSGKPDDTTTEWNTGISFKNYEFVAYLTITKTDHDDTCSMKYGGTHMGSGWYDHSISFQSGQGCLGNEPHHPDTNSCVVKGKSIGGIVGRKIGMAGIFFSSPSGKGGKCEVWADQMKGTGWEKLVEGTNPGGFAPSNSQQECQLRIDAAPGITMDCAVVLPIAAGGAPSPGGGGGGGGAPPPAAGGGGDEGGGGGGDEGGGDSGGGDSGSEYGEYFPSGYQYGSYLSKASPYYVNALMRRPEFMSHTLAYGRFYPPRRRYYR